MTPASVVIASVAKQSQSGSASALRRPASRSPAAAARCFDDDDLARTEGHGSLARHLLDRAVGMDHGVAAGLTVAAAMQPVWRKAAPLRLERHARIVVEDADRPHQPLAAAMPTGPGRSRAQFVALDPQRI